MHTKYKYSYLGRQYHVSGTMADQWLNHPCPGLAKSSLAGRGKAQLAVLEFAVTSTWDVGRERSNYLLVLCTNVVCTVYADDW